MLLIVLIMPPIAASDVPPCLIATIKVFSKFGALEERSYHEIMWLQILKTFREEKNAVRELRRCDERVYMFQCLETITMFTPGLAIFYRATLPLSHVWRKEQVSRTSQR
jgi:hypothetical protein